MERKHRPAGHFRSDNGVKDKETANRKQETVELQIVATASSQVRMPGNI